MADFGEKIQALMDEFYTAWRKEENKSKWDVLDGFSPAHKIAVVLGNFNYQVENGGIEQWIYNGYFHDDGEKLIGYLETGAESDERCRVILDRVYKLDQYANETDCDRYGYYRGSDDRDDNDGFIGEAINCGAFDTWYYEHCGKDDWWQTVCGIIDKAEGRDLPPVQQDEHDGAPDWAVCAEFVYAGEDGGYTTETVEYPTTKERIDRLLAKARIDGIHERVFYVASVETAIPVLATYLPDEWSHNEINYLAANIKAMSGEERECFAACIGAKEPFGDIPQIINISCKDNLQKLYLQPAFSDEQYGDFQLDTQKDETSAIFRRFEESVNPDERTFAKYVLLLEAAVEPAGVGRTVAKEEGGVFTEQGYLTGTGDLRELYRGPEDVPFEYLVYEELTSELHSLSKYIPEDADKSELAYLVEKMTAMDGEQRRLFDAAAEVGWHCGSVAEIVNLTENLDKFNLYPAFNEAEYGEQKLREDWSASQAALLWLEQSDDPADRALHKHITILQRCADEETYGYHAAKENGGVFTSNGYLTQYGDLEQKYRGVQDLPHGYRETVDALERPASGEKPSVLAQIAEAREAQRNNPEQREPSASGRKKSEPEL